MPFFTRVFRGKESSAAKKAAKTPVPEDATPAKPIWTDAWQRTEVTPEEVQELLRGCTQELKARALDTPFLLLPYRPSSDATTARSFIRNYFNNSQARGSPVSGDELAQELRLTDPMVLCSVLKWCWSRLPGGVVTWEAYELFKVGEQDSQLARDAFSTFIPISIDSDARNKIIFDFFDLLTAIAAHGKSNGLGGRKLSRYAGWWAFEHTDTGNGFEAAYKNWAAAADATSHLFFAYLRSLSPDLPRGMGGIATLPIALQSLVQATEYPPETPTLLQVTTTKVVMIVDTVSPTPFALLRRAKNFEYRDSDRHLQEFSGFEDPIQALTDECLRVLKCIASTNQAELSKEKNSASQDESWSRFEDIGFGNTLESDLEDNTAQNEFGNGLKSAPQSSGNDLGRPTTPSWADFMSSGFSGDDNILRAPVAPLLLPLDKVLPPLSTGRGQSSQSHKRTLESEPDLEPGELASIATLELDDSFWWVWISSLAGEEPAARKAVFGRCALVETVINGAKWLVLEEQVRGAAPEPDPGAYIVEKKRFFGLSTRMGKLSRRKSSARKVTPVGEPYKRTDNSAPQSKTSIGPDQHARIQAAAAALQKKHREQIQEETANTSKVDDSDAEQSTKTNSVMTLQPSIVNEASQAMKWAKNYDKHADKNAFRAAYLGDSSAGKGAPKDTLKPQTDDQPGTPASPALSQTPSTSAAQAPEPIPEEDTTPTPSSPAAVPVAAPKSDAVAADQPDASRQGSTTSAAVERSGSESQPKTSLDSTDSVKKLRKKPVAAGFKSMFGTKKRNDTETKPPMKPTGAETSAVAAARAALESKARESQEPVNRPVPNGSSVLKKKPVAGTAPAAEPKKSTTPEVVEVTETEREQTPKAESPAQNGQNGQHSQNGLSPESEQQENLSRVNTKDQLAADQEFSRFDQGPLVEQPAFAPDSPVSPVSESIPERSSVCPELDEEPQKPQEPQEQEPPADSTNGHDVKPEIKNRWAQIRENAAKRAAVTEAQPRSSEADRTADSDGDTSEEESFENRAARIKARVAELTRNMEAAR